MRGRLWRLTVPDQPIRGAYLSLGEDWAALVRERGYSPDQAALLGQAMAAMPLLLSRLKADVKLNLQISQADPLRLLAVQGGSDGRLRGLVKSEGESLDVSALSGQLVVTMESMDGRQTYQGIVALDGAGPAQWLARYFDQSEQLDTRLILVADEHQAGGVLLQAMPGERADIDWQAAMEAIDIDVLPPEPGEWLSIMLGCDLQLAGEVDAVDIHCGCDAQAVSGMLFGLGEAEVQGILAEQGAVTVECGFCGHEYRFGADEVAALFAQGDRPSVVH